MIRALGKKVFSWLKYRYYKNIDINRVRDRITVIVLMVQNGIASVMARKTIL